MPPDGGGEGFDIVGFARLFNLSVAGGVAGLGLLTGHGPPAAAADVSLLRLTLPVIGVEAPDGLGPGSRPGGLASSVLLTASDKRQFLLLIEDGTFTTTAHIRPLAGPRRRPDMLPDGDLTVGHGDIVEAWLTRPTDRYPHGILGDGLEAGGLAVIDRSGRVWQLTLDERSVFEDRRARLVDLDADGADEILVVRSYAERGAALAVVALRDDGLSVIAETPPIGRPQRWLNPIGAADFDADGIVEIAFVETPHIGGTLTLYEYNGGELRLDYIVPGFSNHEIGSYKLDLGAIVDWNGDGTADIAVPAADRRSIRVMTFVDRQATELEVIALADQVKTNLLATDLDTDKRPELIFGLADGRLVWIRSDL